MLLAAENEHLPPSFSSHQSGSISDQPGLLGAGQQLFLKNCAHCHGPDAHGDEGPDLHHLDWSDEEITTRIRNGKKGQMTAFAGKLSPQQISDVIAYLRTLK
jgi:cytochrome c oxidase cbb3-type subunit 3